jgi:hypothetical protein
MDFPVIFLKVSNIQPLTMFKIFVLLFKVSFPLLIISVSYSHTALGWNKEKFTIIGHSYGAIIAIFVSIFDDLHINSSVLFCLICSMQHVIPKK